MIAEKQKNTNIGVGIGIVLEIAGRVLMSQAGGPPGSATANTPLLVTGALLTLAGAVVFIWGCFNYSEGKGYSPWLGLLGLLSCIGLIILIVLPDKFKNGGPPPGNMRGSAPPQPGVWPPPPNVPPS